MEKSHADSFRDLIVYQRSRDVSRMVFTLSRSWPREERYSLTDQIRRSSRSVGAQIAEAWAKRRYEKHFVSKLTDADGEQQETQHWVDEAFDCGYYRLKGETAAPGKAQRDRTYATVDDRQSSQLLWPSLKLRSRGSRRLLHKRRRPGH